MEKKSKVLVLGATGIIGKELCFELSRSGVDVFALSRRQANGIDGVNWIFADVRDVDALGDKISGHSFDAVVDLVSFNSDQVSGILELFKGRCGQYVFVSSATVFDSSDGNVITEKSALVTSGWSYPLEKIQAERLLRNRCRETGQIYTIVRPYITYSPQRVSFGIWEDESVVPRLQAGVPVIIGDELRAVETTLTHSHDLAKAISSLVGNESATNEDFNVVTSESTSWSQVYELAAELLDRNLKVIDCSVFEILEVLPRLRGKVEDRLMRRVFDNTKLMTACPGLEFSYSVRNGYSQILSTYRGSNKTSATTEGLISQLTASKSRDSVNFAPLMELYSNRFSFKQKTAYTISRSAPWLVQRLISLRDGGKGREYGL